MRAGETRPSLRPIDPDSMPPAESRSGKTRVLFVCTGASCRSQMAAGWARHLGGGQVEAFAAGTDPQGLNPRAVASMDEVGIDISQSPSASVYDFLETRSPEKHQGPSIGPPRPKRPPEPRLPRPPWPSSW